jgi:predicted  nucleic acid-binding Zn-ribbon protein
MGTNDNADVVTVGTDGRLAALVKEIARLKQERRELPTEMAQRIFCEVEERRKALSEEIKELDGRLLDEAMHYGQQTWTGIASGA